MKLKIYSTFYQRRRRVYFKHGKPLGALNTGAIKPAVAEMISRTRRLEELAAALEASGLAECREIDVDEELEEGGFPFEYTLVA